MSGPTPPVSIGSSSSSPTLFEQVVNGALLQLQGKVLNIAAEKILNDVDANHKIVLTLPNKETEKASLFALKLKGELKSLPNLINELTQKVENHLKYRENKNLLRFDSGAFLENKTDVALQLKDGYLTVDGKIAVMEKDNKYAPLPTAYLQSYSIFEAHQENDLLILNDEHEKTRADGKEGMIFHLKQPITLTKTDLTSFPADEYFDSLPESSSYLILYRRRSDVPTNENK